MPILGMQGHVIVIRKNKNLLKTTIHFLCRNFIHLKIQQEAKRPGGYTFVSGAGGLKFNSRADKIRHSVQCCQRRAFAAHVFKRSWIARIQ